MNPTRLFILGALAKHGPMYRHQLRHGARLDRADMWSDVRPGSLYGVLHRLAADRIGKLTAGSRHLPGDERTAKQDPAVAGLVAQ